MLIRPKRIYNFCLLHACFVWYCYDLDTLSYTFDHIWTNLLTQCTPVPVPVFCCFSISVFPHIKSARKIPGKIQEKSAYRKLREEPGGPSDHPTRPHPTSGCPPSPIYSPSRGNSEDRTLFRNLASVPLPPRFRDREH